MSTSEPVRPARPGDQARATVTVAVGVDEAFRIFTQEINLWWRRGPRFRNARGPASDQGIICLEPRVDGRVFESYFLNGVETVVEMGRVTEWRPPERLVFRWRASNFAPDERTEVEVHFTSVAASDAASPTAKTQVVVTHRGWVDIRGDHPVRHGLAQVEFIRMMGMWWGDQMISLRGICVVR